MATKRQEAQALLDRELPVGTEVRSNGQGERFKQLTGTSHDKLKDNWKTGGIMTACNGFASWYAGRMGITGIDSYFNLEAALAKIGKSHAWVPADGSRKPAYGDILHHTQGGTGLHVDVCIGFTKDGRLMRAAAGQTLFKSPRKPEAETDVIKRVTGTGPFNFRNLVGWLDLEKFFLPAPAADERESSNWAMGWWDVKDANQYFYFFDCGGHVQYTKSRPAAKFAPPRNPLNAGTYQMRPNNGIFIRWNALTEGSTEETFRAGPDRRSMTGSSRYGALVAQRI
jgi:hypothetical protein